MKILTILCSILLFSSLSAGERDRYEKLCDRLADAACLEVTFAHIVESDIFDQVDTVLGTALLASDGNYRVSFGRDEYLNDGNHLYSYSESANQVVIERSPNRSEASQLTFLRRLRDYYAERKLAEGRYELSIRDTTHTELPSVMHLVMSEGEAAVDRFEYLDINQDANTLELHDVTYLKECDSTRFVPAFPDSVERVRL